MQCSKTGRVPKPAKPGHVYPRSKQALGLNGLEDNLSYAKTDSCTNVLYAAKLDLDYEDTWTQLTQ